MTTCPHCNAPFLGLIQYECGTYVTENTDEKFIGRECFRRQVKSLKRHASDDLDNMRRLQEERDSLQRKLSAANTRIKELEADAAECAATSSEEMIQDAQQAAFEAQAIALRAGEKLIACQKELEQAKQDRNAAAARVRSELLPKMEEMAQEIKRLSQ